MAPIGQSDHVLTSVLTKRLHPFCPIRLLLSDISEIDGDTVFRIETEASKTREYRYVPMHDDLRDQGLLDYVASRGDRPLFYKPSRSRGGRDAGRHFRKVGERLAEWIRSKVVGVTDTNVAPNHGWRHRFSSRARQVEMHIDVQNIIQGHAGDKVASDYGDAWTETGYREITKIPRYVIDALPANNVGVADERRDG